MAEELTRYAESDAIICAIPRGGILSGIAVAKRLKLPLEIMVVVKSEHVTDDASLLCAVTEFGTYVSATDDSMPDAEVQKGVAEARQKRLTYTESEVLPTWEGKTVIVVDDGAESGLTIKAVIEALQAQKATKIIVALPAASASVISWLKKHVDEVAVVKVEPEFTGFIHEHFSHYPEVFDKEVHIAYWHARHLFDENFKRHN